jgi:hypothetical protein
MIRILLVTSVFTAAALAQQAVDPGLTYHRVWAVTPLVGNGTASDPKRPMFVSVSPRAAGDRSGVLAYSMQLSDDGKSALVEFVFHSPVTFQKALSDQAAALGIRVTAVPVPAAGPSSTQTALESAVSGLKMFERGKAAQSDVLAEFQKHKKNFSFTNYHAVPVL